MLVWARPFKGFEEVKVFVVTLSFIISLFVALIFLGIYFRNNKLLLETVKDQAASYVELIVQTRLWNARHGGVYVEKTGDVRSNPYLVEAGIEPDIQCEGNRVLTICNPAQMTQEISRLTRTTRGVSFHMTSQKPINPNNAPDAFELTALDRFEHGAREVWVVDRKITPLAFRYMKPLFVEESCLPCHRQQGYKVGDIRGGISVTIPLAEVDHKMRTNRVMIIVLSLVTIGLLVGVLLIMVRKLVVRLNESRKQLKQMSITDELTGLRNRRYIMERLGEEFQRAGRLEKSLGLIMCDLDYFKEINDTHGHQFGDVVLKAVAARMRLSIREYDLLGRIGGEEFLIISPDSDLDETLRMAERIRNVVKGDTIGDGTKEVTVTISAGVTMLKAEDQTMDSLFSRSDDALYAAKRQGRDKVVLL
jgi:diguanylate cyclase (GGDEF)-like protein